MEAAELVALVVTSGGAEAVANVISSLQMKLENSLRERQRLNELILKPPYLDDLSETLEMLARVAYIDRSQTTIRQFLELVAARIEQVDEHGNWEWRCPEVADPFEDVTDD